MKIKSALLAAVLFGLSAILVWSCSKSRKPTAIDQGKNISSKNSLSRLAIGNFIIFQAQLNRGASHESSKDGSPCNCNKCFGMCEAIILGWKIPDKPANQLTNVLLKGDANGTTATAYFLEQPDNDVTYDNFWHIDDEVTIVDNDNDSTFITPGNYMYSPSGGTVTANGETFVYHGSATVDIH